MLLKTWWHFWYWWTAVNSLVLHFQSFVAYLESIHLFDCMLCWNDGIIWDETKPSGFSGEFINVNLCADDVVVVVWPILLVAILLRWSKSGAADCLKAAEYGPRYCCCCWCCCCCKCWNSEVDGAVVVLIFVVIAGAAGRKATFLILTTDAGVPAQVPAPASYYY